MFKLLTAFIREHLCPIGLLCHQARPIVLLVTLDVPNVFNSARWGDMLEALQRNFGVPDYLMVGIQDYLRDRWLSYVTATSTVAKEVTAGAAQGSILGPVGWCMLFSHPADFTPVCTTELGRIAVHKHEFDKRNVKVLALSCDKLQDHTDWVNDIKSYCRDIPGDFPYPIISDESRELAVLLDMLDAEDIKNPDVAMTVRALYIIDPQKKLRLAMVYPTSTGRNVDEILRVIDSLQLTDKLQVIATPANWVPGEKVMILPSVTDDEAKELFPNGFDKVSMPSEKNYVRTTTDYKM